MKWNWVDMYTQHCKKRYTKRRALGGFINLFQTFLRDGESRMKYRFITVLHNLKLDSLKNKGKVIFDGARISNSEYIFKDTLTVELMLASLGAHSIIEFKDTTYCYIDGFFEGVTNKEEMDKVGVSYTYTLLRNVQFYLDALWEVKDNNVYIRDGFLLVYNNEFDDGYAYKASLSEIYTLSSGEKIDTIISDKDLEQATEKFEPLDLDYYKESEFEGKYPTADYFYKAKGSTRVIRAGYFIKAARNSSILPMKIISYCTALECLFTVGKSEINHKIAERVALLLGRTSESKKEIFKIIKDAYNHRSSLVHGQYLKVTDAELSNISFTLDSYLRAIIKNEYDIFEKSDAEIDEYFLNLLFK